METNFSPAINVIGPTSSIPDLLQVETYHLFGFPIAHSASPALHNYIFDRLGLPRTYKLTQTTHVGERMRALCHASEFGGASVTMPLKVSVAEILDRTTEAAHRIGAINTIVPVKDDQGHINLVGTNTDWLGVRNALLNACPVFSKNFGRMGAALVIGGGGAARAAVYALASLHCTPIYLVGRDSRELTNIVTQFPEILCVPIPDSRRAHDVVVAVACVPAVAPVTAAERDADACAREILAESSGHSAPSVFLEMCYKPRTTPLMLHAQRCGWKTVPGIEAMLEQGFAQARMWLAKSVDPGAGGDSTIPSEVEEGARKRIREMPEIVVKPGDEILPAGDDEFENRARIGRHKFNGRL